jgi:hypothetical protein
LIATQERFWPVFIFWGKHFPKVNSDLNFWLKFSFFPKASSQISLILIFWGESVARGLGTKLLAHYKIGKENLTLAFN